MKKTLLALAVLALSGSAFATNYSSPSAVVSGSGTNKVTSGTYVSVGASGNGASSSGSAYNTQSASSWFGGSGSIGKPGPWAGTVTIDNCDTVYGVGTKQVGEVNSFGGTLTSGYSKATVTGTGAAAAGGTSYAAVEGQAEISNGKFSLGAGGSAASLVGTDTGWVYSGSVTSEGKNGSGWNSTQKGSLIEYVGKTSLFGPTITGDQKTITSNANGYAGKISNTVGGNNCQPGKCVQTNASGTANAVLESGATAWTNGSIVNVIGKP